MATMTYARVSVKRSTRLIIHLCKIVPIIGLLICALALQVGTALPAAAATRVDISTPPVSLPYGTEPWTVPVIVTSGSQPVNQGEVYLRSDLLGLRSPNTPVAIGKAYPRGLMTASVDAQFPQTYTIGVFYVDDPGSCSTCHGAYADTSTSASVTVTGQPTTTSYVPKVDGEAPGTTVHVPYGTTGLDVSANVCAASSDVFSCDNSSGPVDERSDDWSGVIPPDQYSL